LLQCRLTQRQVRPPALQGIPQAAQRVRRRLLLLACRPALLLLLLLLALALLLRC
jgi:hypothetical protein